MLVPGYAVQSLPKGCRARLGDPLIAQSCADHGISLITRNKDFHAFAEAANLDLPLCENATPLSNRSPSAPRPHVSCHSAQRRYDRRVGEIGVRIGPITNDPQRPYV
jgi:hypothetical protein